MPAPSRTPIPLTPEEQRKSGRPRVLLAGRLIYGEAGLTMDCTIRDRTENGARLKLTGPAVLPQRMTLIEIGSGMAHECELTWRRFPEIGVSFVSSTCLMTKAAEDAPELQRQRLRRMWQDAKPR
jgi:hypothetical protein